MSLRYLVIAILFCIVGITACFRKDVNPRVEQLQTALQKMEQENAKYDDKLRDARSDPGLRMQLNSDRELLKSRMERVKEQLKEETKKSD